MAKRRNKPGPKPDHLKMKGNWQDAIKKGIAKKPPEGWPESKPSKS